MLLLPYLLFFIRYYFTNENHVTDVLNIGWGCVSLQTASRYNLADCVRDERANVTWECIICPLQAFG